MSHIVSIDIKIVDLDAVKKAADELGWEFKQEARKYRVWDTEKWCAGGLADCQGGCLVIPRNNYDIGLVEQEDGSFLPVYDDMIYHGIYGAKAMTMSDQEKSHLGGFLQKYAVHAAENVLRKNHKKFTRQVMEDGKVQLRVTA